MPRPLMSHSFTQNRVVGQHCKPHNMKDERLVSKIEGKTNSSRHLKQFDGLVRLTPTPSPRCCLALELDPVQNFMSVHLVT